jgi:hypothetical protein
MAAIHKEASEFRDLSEIEIEGLIAGLDSILSSRLLVARLRAIVRRGEAA